MALKHRIEKLERRGGRDVPPFIVFIKGQKTEAEAIAEWEAINGLSQLSCLSVLLVFPCRRLCFDRH